MNYRIYPDHIPETEAEPTKDDFEIINSSSFGLIIISKKYFKIGDLIAAPYSGVILNKRKLHTVQIGRDKHLLDEWFAGILAHSCNPNTRLDQIKNSFYAIKDILPGDSITHDYDATEDGLSRVFNCNCEAVNCRGIIQGNKKY